MPGDNVEMEIELIQPIAMEEGLRFAIREGGRTVGAGVVGKIISSKSSRSYRRLAPAIGAGRGFSLPTEKGARVQQNKIRIRLKAYDTSDRSGATEIVETAQRTGATVSGPVPLPTEKNVYCVIRSPFKDKDSREHFEIRTHKRLIDIHQPTPKTVDSLQRLDLPAGVDIEITASPRERWPRSSARSSDDPDLPGGRRRVARVTVLEAGPCPVPRSARPSATATTAVQLAFGDQGEARSPSPSSATSRRPTRRRCATSSSSATRRRGLTVGEKVTVDVFEPGETREGLRARRKGKGFQGTIKRHNFASGPKSPRLAQRPRARARSAPRRMPSRVMKGIRGCRADGQQARHPARPGGRRGRRRAEPAARPGLGSRARTAHRGGAHRCLTPRCSAATRPLKKVKLDERRFGARFNPGRSIHAERARGAGRAPARHAPRRKTRADGLRRRRQAVAPEGHRPRPRRLEPLADLDRRRHRLRPAARAPTPSRSTARSSAPALRSALSLHAERGSIAVLDACAFAAPKTSQALDLLEDWSAGAAPRSWCSTPRSRPRRCRSATSRAWPCSTPRTSASPTCSAPPRCSSPRRRSRR